MLWKFYSSINSHFIFNYLGLKLGSKLILLKLIIVFTIKQYHRIRIYALMIKYTMKYVHAIYCQIKCQKTGLKDYE